jgi:hypothetical protein
VLTGSEVLEQAKKAVNVDKEEDEVAVQRTKTSQNDSADSNNEIEKEEEGDEEGDEDGEELTPHP